MRRLLPDITAFVGLASLTVGVWMIYPPAAFITLGVLLLASAIGLDNTSKR
jgi:hypothetical protein